MQLGTTNFFVNKEWKCLLCQHVIVFSGGLYWFSFSTYLSATAKQNEKYNHGQINFVKSIRQFIILFKVFTPISINLKPSDKKDETIKWG